VGIVRVDSNHFARRMLNTVRVPEEYTALFEQAQEYVSRYFGELQMAPERGTLELGGQRYVLVRAASMSVEFFEMVKSLYREDSEAVAVAQSLLFDVAHAMGHADGQAFAERMNLTDPIARVSAGPVHFAHAGWAFVDISSESEPTPNENYYLLYDHPYSFESDSWLNANKPSSHPVCVMNAGYSSGWCEHSFGRALVATEILCRAKGDEFCRFIMATPDRIEQRIAAYLERNPKLAPSVVNYHVPGFFTKRTDKQLLRKNLELEERAQERARELAQVNEELKRDIRERERTETRLSETLELNERLMEVLPGGIVHVAADGGILHANGEALRILGLTYDELTKRYVSDFGVSSVFEDGSPAPASEYPVSRAIATGQPQPATTIGMRKPNGEISWAMFRAVPTRDSQSQAITGAVCTFLDITERKRFEDKLRHTQKLESLGVLAGGIAHDFNNLLVTILGNASLARSLPECTSKVATLLEEVELGARRAADLTKQMLDYAGQGRSRIENVELPAVVREMAKLVKALIPKLVVLHHHVQEGLPRIDADPTQLRQVIMNLITNAAEAIGQRPGRIVVSVEQHYVSQAELDSCLGAAAPGEFVCLEVTDDGAGMDSITAARVFDPFFTTKFKGRGLGMAAVLGIVRGHRGAIRIESREGMGTRVRTFFPAPRQEVELTAPSGDPRSTILIVDDDDGVRSVGKAALASAGYQVVTAANGSEGLRMFERYGSQLKLILMDVTMPGVDGFEALRRIRAGGSLIPVLLTSGYDVDPSAAAAASSSGILEKPYDVSQLLEAVRRAL
jgi:two-component system cell cycle sensor histidine kinase/response regulator CckA